jgi:hypothetical protein
MRIAWEHVVGAFVVDWNLRFCRIDLQTNNRLKITKFGGTRLLTIVDFKSTILVDYGGIVENWNLQFDRCDL